MSEPARDKPAVYKIRVQGVVPDDWADRMSGLTIAVLGDPDTPAITTLTGVIPDQDTLESILSTLYSLGLPLLSVEYLSAAPASQSDQKPPAGNAAEGNRST